MKKYPNHIKYLKRINATAFNKELEDKNKCVKVTYTDKVSRYFGASNWIGNRASIINNIYNNGKCDISIVTNLSLFDKLIHLIKYGHIDYSIVKYKR
ncbi:MAG: hypothetical protein ACOWWH_12660 [Eubacteriaceae bacterium]